MKDYKINVDGEKHQFEGGAIRYNKNKGRMDLIPAGPLRVLLNYIRTDYDCKLYLADRRVDTESYLRVMCLQALDSIMLSENTAEQNKALAETICSLVILNRATVQCCGGFPVYPHTLIEFDVPELLLDLSVHFQKGAEKYGEHNCEKGIPLWSFIDSGRRHTVQFIKHADDGENHYISAVWNFWMAIWTNLQNNRVSASDYKADKKMTENETKQPNSEYRNCDYAYYQEIAEVMLRTFKPLLLGWITEYFNIDFKKMTRCQEIIFKRILGEIWEKKYMSKSSDICAKDLLMMVVEDPKHRVERFVRQIGASKNGPQNNRVSASDDKVVKSEVNCSRESCNTNQGSKLSGYEVEYMTYRKIIDMTGPILLHLIYDYFDIDAKKFNGYKLIRFGQILGEVWGKSGISDFDENLCPKDYLMIINDDPEHQVANFVHKYGLSTKKKLK